MASQEAPGTTKTASIANIAPVTIRHLAEPQKQPTNCDLVNEYDWDTRIAHAICMAESSGDPHALGHNKNGTNDAGLMQINSIHVASGLISDTDRFDPQKNMAAAFKIYKSSGWKAWSTYNNKRYLKFM